MVKLVAPTYTVDLDWQLVDLKEEVICICITKPKIIYGFNWRSLYLKKLAQISVLPVLTKTIRLKQ